MIVINCQIKFKLLERFTHIKMELRYNLGEIWGENEKNIIKYLKEIFCERIKEAKNGNELKINWKRL